MPKLPVLKGGLEVAERSSIYVLVESYRYMARFVQGMSKGRNFLYSRLYGGIEAGTLVLLILLLLFLDPSLYGIFSVALILIVGLIWGGLILEFCFGWCTGSNDSMRLTESVLARKSPAAAEKIEREAEYDNTKALVKRRLHLVGVRLIEGRLELFHVLVQSDLESWLVWRSKNQLIELRRCLVTHFPNIAIPSLPSILINSFGGEERNMGENEDTARIQLVRHQGLVCAWLQILNDTPILRDSELFCDFLDDRAAIRRGTSGDHLSRPALPSDITMLSSEQEDGEDPPFSDQYGPVKKTVGSKSTIQRIKAIFGSKSKRKTEGLALPKESFKDETTNPSAPLVNEDQNPSYQNWLKAKQKELCFTGDSYETIAFTDISPEALALYKDTGMSLFRFGLSRLFIMSKYLLAQVLITALSYEDISTCRTARKYPPVSP